MTTTDTDALTERLTEAVRETLMDDHGAGSDLAYVSWDGEQWLAVEGGIDIPHLIDAVLPIVDEEVRKAKAEALREAAEAVNPYPTIRYTIPQELRERADRIDAGGDDEQSQMVDDISSIIMRGRYGRSGVGRPSDNPIDLRDARRIVEYVIARDARTRRDAAREALDGFKAWRGTRQCPAISPPDPCNRPEGHSEPHAYTIPEGECDWREVDWSDTDIYRDQYYPEEPHE